MAIFIGNWKMYKSEKEAVSYIRELKPLVQDIKAEIAIAAPFTLLNTLKKETAGTNIKVAAQDVFFEKEGAFTGEISPPMVKEYADYVIIGHSERRKYFGETDEIINKKIKAALDAKLKVVFCLGETLADREMGDTMRVVENQLRQGLEGVNLNKVIIAYEPVWAIGTGKNATPEQAQEVHQFIRKLLMEIYRDCPIIYGGSVTPQNVASLLKMPDVDGCLPGGSSLEPKKFSEIIKSL
jgi:triosephosphate isomerase (TIM)